MPVAGGGTEMAPEIHHQDVVQVHVERAAAAHIAPEGTAEGSGTGKTGHQQQGGAVQGAEHAVAIAEMPPGAQQKELSGRKHHKQQVGTETAQTGQQQRLVPAYPHAEQQEGKGHRQEIAVDVEGQLAGQMVGTEQQGHREKQGQQTQTGVHQAQTEAAPEEEQGLHIGGEVPQHAVVGMGQQQVGPELLGKQDAAQLHRGVMRTGIEPGVEVVVAQIDQGGEQVDAEDVPQGAADLPGIGLAAVEQEIAGDHEEDGNGQTGQGLEIGLAVEVGVDQHHGDRAEGLQGIQGGDFFLFGGHNGMLGFRIQKKCLPHREALCKSRTDGG